MKFVLTMIHGGCMAVADSVPGVSGGTIAFILGFYDDLIFSLSHLFRGTREERKNAVLFLVKLMLGWAIGFSASVLLLGKIFESHIYELCSLFLGLTVFALPLMILEEKETLRGKYYFLGFTLLGVLIVGLITFFNPTNGQGGSVDILHLNFGTVIYIFLVAMAAISAMVMPGISGSTLLLVFGLYVPVISGIKEFLHLNFQYLPALIAFGFGVLAGIFTTIRLVKLGLEKARPQMVYLILGLMIGSLYAILMGPTTLTPSLPMLSLSTFRPFFFLLGGVILLGLQLLKKLTKVK